jgi:tetratricopeptide (TPR) repeat protein
MVKKQSLTLIYLLISSVFTIIHAQTVLHIKNGCHFDGDETPKDIYGYDPSNEAVEIISRITTAIGLEQNYTIKAANVSNALASTEGGQRYILYNTTFLENFKRDAQTKWAAYCVLAHEVGHHLNNHDFTETNVPKRKLLELAADRFAGNVLQKMGATLTEAQAGINTFSTEENKTHPPKSARLEAVASGWKQSEEKEAEKETPQYNAPKTKLYDEKKAQEWLDKAFNETDDSKKIEYITTALEYKPDDANALYNRGIAKENLRKFKEAIVDYDASIKLNALDDNVFCSRGWAKFSLNKCDEAIIDYDEAIRLNPNYSGALYNRGLAKSKLNRTAAAIADFSAAILINPKFYGAYNSRGWEKFIAREFAAAIVDFDEAIRLKPIYPIALGNRGWAKYQMGQYNEAITDFDTIISIDPKDARAYANKGCCLIKLMNKTRFKEAIELIDKALLMDNTLTYAKECREDAVHSFKK